MTVLCVTIPMEVIKRAEFNKCYTYMNKLYLIFFLSVLLCSGCTNTKERIIFGVCKDIIQSYGITPEARCTLFLEVEELRNTQDSILYEINISIYQAGDPIIEYTDYRKIKGTYVFLKEQYAEKKKISPEMKEELYTWGSGGMRIETPTLHLRLNKTDLKYHLEELPWAYSER